MALQLEELQEQMVRKSDEELYLVLSHSSDYVPEAVDSAKQELSKRKLHAAEISSLQALAEQARQAEETAATKPLPWTVRILMFLFPIGLLQAILAEHYRNRGFKRKYRECWRWMIYGIVFYVAVFVLLLVQAMSMQ